MRTVQDISSILENIGVTEEEYIEMSLRMLEVFQARSSMVKIQL